jgi:hypothetical protein
MFLVETLKRTGRLEEQHVHGDNIKMTLFRSCVVSGDWIHFSQDGDQWRFF